MSVLEEVAKDRIRADQNRRWCEAGECRYATTEVRAEPPTVDRASRCDGWEGTQRSSELKTFVRWRLCERHRKWWKVRQAYLRAGT